MFPAFTERQDTPAVHAFQEIFLLELFVGPEVVVGHLGLFGEPVPRVLFWTVIPTVRQVAGPELLLSDGNCIQKLVVQLRVGFRLHLADVGDI